MSMKITDPKDADEGKILRAVEVITFFLEKMPLNTLENGFVKARLSTYWINELARVDPYFVQQLLKALMESNGLAVVTMEEGNRRPS